MASFVIIAFNSVQHGALKPLNNLCFKLFNRDLNRGCLIYIFSFRNFLINLLLQFHVRKFFSRRQLRAQVFGLCSKLLCRKCVTYVRCSFIKTCSLTGC